VTDPEIEYRRLVSGDAPAVRAVIDALDGVLHTMVGVREDLTAAGEVPVWSGPAAMAFAARASGLRQGLGVTRAVLVRARGALETAASAYESAEDQAEHYIAFWRNRPAGLPPAVEEIFARVVNARLLSVGLSYNQQLAAVEAVLRGEDVDLDDLDDETRKWVEEGMAKNEEWLGGNDSDLGPIIPNTAATGDGRGWIPQGLGYDPRTGTLLQSYYTKDDEGHGDASYLALIDEVTGAEVGEVTLGDTHLDADGNPVSGGKPTHAGGVSVRGDDVYVVDNGEVYTYSLAALQSAAHGETVPQKAPPQTGLDGGSYSAVKDGRLYLGDHEKDELYVYEQDATGRWVKVDTVDTPPSCQGVLVRDGEYVFSASSGRHEDHSQLYVQDLDGTRSEPYDLPSMSQGVVEIDGELVVTYESGAEEFDHAITGTSGWWWLRDDYGDLWANPHMTRTPLSELDLAENIDVEPRTLLGAAAELGALVGTVKGAADEVRGLRVPGGALGEVPRAATLAAAVQALLGAAASSLGTGASAISAAAELLTTTSSDYSRTDDRVAGGFRVVTPG
jgi:uncharacterized protein YukE